MNSNSVVIIGGLPWAGTRQFADFMNGSELFDIRGEVYNDSFNSLASLFSACDKDHVGKWSEKNYRKWRHLSVLNSLAGISKGYNQPFSDDGVVKGFKCPWIERSKGQIDILFQDVSVDFFVCLRSLSQIFLVA